MHRMLLVPLAALLATQLAAAQQDRSAADAIRLEAIPPNDSPEGWPLPLVSHWNTGRFPKSEGWTPQKQMVMIEQGHHLLPWFAHPPRDAALSDKAQAEFVRYYEAPLKKARQLRLPLVFVCTQWESLLSADPYLSLPPGKNPNVVTVDGKIQRKVCPFGPVEPWREAGSLWTANPQFQRIQQWYPDPPLVIFLSNNEHAKLRWTEVEQSERYLEKYGKGRDDDFRRKVVADGWIERYRALQDGMRQGLVSQRWRQCASFVGYDAFGPPHLGRWNGWPAYSLHCSGRISPAPFMWDGGSPSYYTNDWDQSTDYTVWSPQIEFMNLVFMQQEALKLNPRFWLEFSVWDGYHGPDKASKQPSKRTTYERAGQTCSPQRYGGFVQFGMWLLRPRAVREFRGWTFPSEEGMPYFLAIVAAVDRVYENPTLRQFWRKGRLVANSAHKHPYDSNVPVEYRDAARWFLLDADANPQQFPWALSQQIPVFSLALVQGQAPQRQWLMYAHSPLTDRQGVRISLPEYRDITVDVSVGGSFYLIDERLGSVAAVN